MSLWQRFTEWRAARKQARVNAWRASQNARMQRSHTFASPAVLHLWLTRNDDAVARDQELVDAFGCGADVMVSEWQLRDFTYVRQRYENVSRIPKSLTPTTEPQ